MRTFLVITPLAASLAASHAADATTTTAKPNIVLTISDQHTADAMSCAGYPQVKTPALDGLAAAGVRLPTPTAPTLSACRRAPA